MSTIRDLRLRPRDLVAVAMPPGPAWLVIVRSVWAVGAAVMPLDHRLTPAETSGLLGRARPTALVTPDGAERLDDGVEGDPQVALVINTSGTGGTPKLAQFDRRAVDAAVAASALAVGATPQDRWLCCLPLAHVGGLLVLLRGVVLGAPVTVHPAFDVDAFARETEAVFTSVVPAMLGRLLDADVALERYRAILVGGAPLPGDIRTRALARGARVVETYGLTESCGGVVYDGVPLRGIETRIGVDGGIELRGPTLMLGYRFDPAGTAEAFTDDGWLRAGDAGEIDRAGRLRVIGRMDDLINSGGEKIWPTEVEAALRTHPKVGEVAVGGRVDPGWGQRVVAWIVPVEAGDAPSLDELRDHVSATLARHKAPREIVVVETLPRTGIGKVRRGALEAAE